MLLELDTAPFRTTCPYRDKNNLIAGQALSSSVTLPEHKSICGRHKQVCLFLNDVSVRQDVTDRELDPDFLTHRWRTERCFAAWRQKCVRSATTGSIHYQQRVRGNWRSQLESLYEHNIQ